MCRPTTCGTCGRTTWAGCGKHVEQVMAAVPHAERCPGHADRPRPPSGSLLARLLGRG